VLRPKAGFFRRDRKVDVNLRMLTSGLQLALRAATAAGLSLAQLFKLEHPIYALIAAVIAADLSPSKTSQLGLRRLVATVVGAACGATLSPVVQSGPWGIGVSICIAILVCALLQVQNSAKVAGYVCGIVVLAHRTDPWSCALFRFIETTLGIGVVWVTSFVPKLFQIDES
jgi:uncharacterized membrane protein YgaE (UPF0421/DUF939 family)